MAQAERHRPWLFLLPVSPGGQPLSSCRVGTLLAAPLGMLGSLPHSSGSQFGSQAGSISVTRELVRNADSLAPPPPTDWKLGQEVGGGSLNFNKPPM